MPVSETSYLDRLGRGRTMQAAIAGFSPAFAPADTSLLPAAFATFLDSLDTLNTTTVTLVDQYLAAADGRKTTVKNLYDRAGRILAYVASNTNWAKQVRSVKTIVDKIRGNEPRPPKPPTGAETPDQNKQRSSGERSYAEMEGHLNRLIPALEAIAGYAPPAIELTLVHLEGLASSLHTQNLNVANLERQTAAQQAERSETYNGDAGLREKMKAIKAAARAQYGSSSSEYESVKSIAL
ncbi:MAG: hypothetical protein AABP62_21750 [Planctomycetota bacterium]